MGNLTVKESGEMVNFISPNVNNITSFKVHFSPKQEGTGDPSPDNVREITGWNGVEGYSCGKNLAHIFGYGTQNIIDTDVNKYKTTNSYGTTINTTIFNNPDTPLIIEQSQAPNSTMLSGYQNGYIVIGTDNLIFGQKYNVSFKVSNITNNILNISLNNIKLLVPNGTTTKVTEIIDDVLIFKNITFYQNTTTPKRQGFEIRICGFSFTLSEFMVTSVDNEDFTYEPYQETELNINWTNNIKQWTYTNSTFNTYSSNIFNGYANSLWDYAIENIPAEWFNKSLTYSVYIDRAESPYTPYDDVRVWFYGDSTTMKEASSAYRITEPSSSGRSWVTFTIPEGTTKLALGLLISKGSRAYNPQLEYGEEPTEYQPYVGDVYGGYVDLVSGEIYKGFEQIIFDGNTKFTSITKYKDGNRFMYNKALLTLPIKNYGMCYFNYYTNIKTNKFINNGFIGSTGNILIYTDTSIDSIDLLTEYQTNNPLQSVYELETPVYIATLTPQQLSTLKGQNNFWSNADYVEIEYELTETFDIQKAKRKIILSQPHVETASGDIITFDTDMRGKLKECKVYFTPVQEGEGDPSPDNVRNITGWNGITATRSGKNLVEVSAETRVYQNPTSDTNFTEDNNIIIITGFSNGGYRASCKPNTQYTYSCEPTLKSGGVYLRVWEEIGEERNMIINQNVNSTKGAVATFTTGSDVYSLIVGFYVYSTAAQTGLTISDFQLELGDTRTAYEPYQSTAISIDWTDSAGTVYDGYVDLISGELVANMAIVDLGTLIWTYNEQYTTFVSYPVNLMSTSTYKKGLCSQYVITEQWLTSQGWADNDKIFTVRGQDSRIRIKDTTYTDASAFKTSVDGVQFVYELADPIHYQLTPQQLITLRGINNIWSSANGEIEIKYWKH